MNTMTDNPVSQRIRQTIDNSDVVLFMKGTPIFPQCGFSATLVQVLSLMGVKFKGFDDFTIIFGQRISSNIRNDFYDIVSG